jgi:hypothetical protein
MVGTDNAWIDHAIVVERLHGVHEVCQGRGA